MANKGLGGVQSAILVMDGFEPGAVRERPMTSPPSFRSALRNAGAVSVDTETWSRAANLTISSRPIGR